MSHEHIEVSINHFINAVTIWNQNNFGEKYHKRYSLQNDQEYLAQEKQYRYAICKLLLSFRKFTPPTDPLNAEEVAECCKLFSTGDVDFALTALKIPPTMRDCIIPIAIMRRLLGIGHLNMSIESSWSILVHDKEECPWNYFAKHWMNIILYS